MKFRLVFDCFFGLVTVSDPGITVMMYVDQSIRMMQVVSDEEAANDA